MNNYQNVFDLIKKECNESNSFQSDTCHELITTLLANKHSLPIHFYLDSLTNLGMITCTKEHRIVLTPKGIATTELFTVG